MPAMHFASAFSLSAFHPPPSLPLIHQWQNLGDVCFITCLIAFLSLLAKQGFWKGQSCHPTCRGVPTYLQPQKKAFSSSSAKRYDKFTAAVKKQRTPVFTCCYTAEVRDKIRNQLKQCVCMSVIVSPAQYQRVVCYGLFASQPALCELCECCRARCVCVYECVVVFVCVCVCFITKLQMVFSQWCISCWHLDKCLPSRAALPFMLNQERTTQTTATFGVCVPCYVLQTYLFILNVCFTNPELNAQSEHVCVCFTWSQQ